MLESIFRLARLQNTVVLTVLSSPAFAQAGFTPGTDMNYARSFHTATLLADGTVLIAGGYNNTDPVYTPETYDPSTGAFTPTGPMLNDYPSSATLLPDGRALLAGGTAQLYDPSTRTFATTGNGATPNGCAATLLNNGKVLFTGDPPPYGVSATAQLYDPETGSFTPTGPYASLEIAQTDHANIPGYGGWDCRRATLLPNGTVLVVGGVAAEIYDPQTNTFSLTGTLITRYSFVTTLPIPWGDPADASPLLNGMVLFSGGDEDLGPSQGAWLYDPSSGTFRTAGPMISSRTENPTTLLPDGTVLIAGGRYYGAIDSAELYDSVADMFVGVGPMVVPRCAHTATLLANGQVMIAGGINDSGNLSSTEIYTPAIVVPAPQLFALPGGGENQGAIWHSATGIIASPDSPAVGGDILSMYTTNLSDGGAIPPQVSIGGRFADVLYFGPAPGYPGYYQVNFRVPDGTTPATAVPIRLRYLGRSTNQVTIAIR